MLVIECVQATLFYKITGYSRTPLVSIAAIFPVCLSNTKE